jgi:hypothetical protein
MMLQTGTEPPWLEHRSWGIEGNPTIDYAINDNGQIVDTGPGRQNIRDEAGYGARSSLTGEAVSVRGVSLRRRPYQMAMTPATINVRPTPATPMVLTPVAGKPEPGSASRTTTMHLSSLGFVYSA